MLSPGGRCRQTGLLLLENASIFSMRCSPLHAPLGQRTTQGHTGGLQRCFSRCACPREKQISMDFPAPGRENSAEGFLPMQECLTFLRRHLKRGCRITMQQPRFHSPDSLGRAVAVEQVVLLFRLVRPDTMPAQPHLGHAVLLHRLTLHLVFRARVEYTLVLHHIGV